MQYKHKRIHILLFIVMIIINTIMVVVAVYYCHVKWCDKYNNIITYI